MVSPPLPFVTARLKILALALYKVLFLAFVCITGFAVLGGAKAGGTKEGDHYGKENFSGSFRQQTMTTPYSYAKSLLSILYAFRGWYVSSPADRLQANIKSGKMRIMLV